MPQLIAANTPLPIDIDTQVDLTLISAHDGVPLVIELFRRMEAALVTLMDYELPTPTTIRAVRVSAQYAYLYLQSAPCTEAVSVCGVQYGRKGRAAYASCAVMLITASPLFNAIFRRVSHKGNG